MENIITQSIIDKYVDKINEEFNKLNIPNKGNFDFDKRSEILLLSKNAVTTEMTSEIKSAICAYRFQHGIYAISNNSQMLHYNK